MTYSWTENFGEIFISANWQGACWEPGTRDAGELGTVFLVAVVADYGLLTMTGTKRRASGKATTCDEGGFGGYLHLRIQRILRNRSKFSSSQRKKLKLGDKTSALTHPAKAVVKIQTRFRSPAPTTI